MAAHVLAWLAGFFTFVFVLGSNVFSDTPPLRSACQWLAAASLLCVLGFNVLGTHWAALAVFVLAGLFVLFAGISFLSGPSAGAPKQGA